MYDRRLVTYTYEIYVTDALPIGGDVAPAREYLAGVALDAQERDELEELDRILLEALLAGDVTDDVLHDNEAQPLDHWWWHLGAIRAGTFPTDRLPKHLREIITSS